MSINYFTEDIDFNTEKIKTKKDWLVNLVKSYDYSIEELNYIFCSDEYLLEINQQYLEHNTYTDIITFDNSEEEEGLIESDIFISIDRIKENAKINKVTFDNELSRVMAHGLLHLLGFGDKTNEEKENMRNAEDKALKMLS